MPTEDTGRQTATPGPSDDDAPDLSLLRAELTAAGAPDSVLQILADPDADPATVWEALEEAGMLPPQDQLLANLLDGWKPLLEPACDALAAELAGSEFAGMVRSLAADEADVPDMLRSMIEQAETTKSPEALAMARALAAVGPPEIRSAAAEAGDRLVASGIKDRPWAQKIGAPKAGACFGYTDEFGSQESIAITFSYGRKRHAVVVLIDHGLGSGIKDCFVTDDAARVHRELQRAASTHGLDLDDFEPTEARRILEKALAAGPCPVEPDQVEDVGSYLELLRQRVDLLTGRARATATRRQTVYRLKVTLRHSSPPIWRRLEVPSDVSLERLHDIIQDAFGWEGYHLWVFSTKREDYGLPDPQLGYSDAAAARLNEVATRKASRIRYTYDFGDDWQHDIVVEEVIRPEPEVDYPRCVAGRRACPPEDCGGIWGYEQLLEVLADPAHPEHEERLDWLAVETAAEFDPAEFDRDAVNGQLSRFVAGPVSGGR